MREAGVDTGLLENDAGKEAMGIKNWLMNKLFASVFTSNVPAIQVMGQQLVELLLLRRWCLRSWKIWSWMSPWPHGRHPRVLKEVALEIVEALVVIFQQSLWHEWLTRNSCGPAQVLWLQEQSILQEVTCLLALKSFRHPQSTSHEVMEYIPLGLGVQHWLAKDAYTLKIWGSSW